jgi:hypothetical protein
MKFSVAKRGGPEKAPNAVSLLKADHRRVKEWFKEFEDAS